MTGDNDNKISRDDMPPPTAVRRWQKLQRIYVRPRTGPQSAHLWWPAVAKLQAASVPIAAPWTDRRTERGRAGGIKSDLSVAVA